jgi:hypothetical protein
VEPTPLGEESEAGAWLERTLADDEARTAAVDAALHLLNRALHVQRAAAADPLVHEVGEPQAAAIRVGYGSGDGVVDSRWSDARELPRNPAKRHRSEQLRPQERLAAVLGGREAVNACETLILRARVDLDEGRTREAALQVRVGLEALLAELDADSAGAGQAADMAALDASREGIGAAANAALGGELDERLVAAVREAIVTCERVLRRRRILS